jgi:hypothetical protein
MNGGILQRILMGLLLSASAGLLGAMAYGQEPAPVPAVEKSATENTAVERSSESLVQSVRAALRLRLGYPDLPYAGGLGQTSGEATQDTPPLPRELSLTELLRIVELYHTCDSTPTSTRRRCGENRRPRGLAMSGSNF